MKKEREREEREKRKKCESHHREMGEKKERNLENLHGTEKGIEKANCNFETGKAVILLKLFFVFI